MVWLWAIERVRWSGRQTIRVIVRADGPLRGEPAAVVKQFAPLKVQCEVMQQPVRMVAIDIAPDVAADAVKSLLEHGVADGWWDFAEACVSDDWHAR